MPKWVVPKLILSALAVAALSLATPTAFAQSNAADQANDRNPGVPKATQPATPPETPPSDTNAEAGDADLEALYEDEPSDPDIETIKVLGSQNDGASDFDDFDSVAAFDAADLEALGAQSIADLASFTPNLEIVTSGATTPTFFIRGVGLNDFNVNSSGAVAVYFNDVPKNSPAIQLGTLFDVENVNILRGPQGTGNYRSASAGAIRIYSKKPTGNYNAYLRQSYGNYGAVDLEGAVGAPIFEDILAGRLAFRFSDREGYATNGCGNAQPRSEREIRPGVGATRGTDPRWSQCGDDVPFEFSSMNDGTGGRFDGKSLVPPGLPRKVNNQHNWSARGSLFFQPTLDQEWLLILSGGKRDEQSRQGQSHGTNREGGSLIGSFGTAGRGVLGSEDGTSYIPQEVQETRWKLDPCRDNKTGSAIDSNGDFICADDGGGLDARRATFSNFASRAVLARDLARNLDSKPHHGDYNAPGPTQLETWGVSIRGDIVLAQDLKLTTVTGFDSYDRLVASDLDQSPNTNFEIVTDDDGWQVAQTTEIEGVLSESFPVTWSLGSLFLYEELNVGTMNQFAGAAALIGVSAREYKQKLWSGGAFGHASYTFWEKFTIDAGVRYNWEKKSMNYLLERAQSLDFPLYRRRTWQAPTGTVRFTYNFDESTYAFWKYTRGWKGGHFNATGTIEGITFADPENIDSFEFGLHGTWFTGLLSVDASLFHYNYENYQLFTAQQRFDGLPEFVVLNAANSEVYGSEMDITLRPTPATMLRARLAWLETQFLDYTQIQVERREFGFGNQIVLNNEIQNTGNPLLNSPNFKVGLTAQQTVPLGQMGTLTARWDGAWTDDTNFDATQTKGVPNFDGDQFLPKHTIGQRAYWLHNVRLSYTTPSGGVELAGWVRNLEDKVYKNFAFDVSSFNGTTIFFLGEPRTYGVSLFTSF